jgi:hypothetical protein
MYGLQTVAQNNRCVQVTGSRLSKRILNKKGHNQTITNKKKRGFNFHHHNEILISNGFNTKPSEIYKIRKVQGQT